MPKSKSLAVATEPATAKSYVIMEMADEYNDEIYRLQDSGTPVKVYTDKEVAESACLKLQIEKLKGLEIGQYAYDLDELTSTREGWNRRGGKSAEEIKELLPFCKFKGDEDDFNNWTIPENLTDEQLALVDSVFPGLRFFTVVEV